LVVVVIIFALGITSFRSMKPELLPNLELPYVLAMTTYPGATSEKVETEVTRPLEQGFATLEGLKSISSQSRANFSMISMEFVDGVNLDGVTIEMLQRIDRLRGGWDDLISSPVIIKMNPNLMPVIIAAVEQQGATNAELSRLMEEELQLKLEGIDGVASLSVSGMRREQINVVIREDYVTGINDKLAAAIEKEIGDKEQDLINKKADLQSTLNELKAKNTELEDGVKQFADGISGGSTQLAQSWADFGIPLAVQLAELRKTLEELQIQLKKVIRRNDPTIKAAAEAAIQTAINSATADAIAQAEPMIQQAIDAAVLAAEDQAASFGLPPLTPEQIQAISDSVREQYVTNITDQVLAGFTPEVRASIADMVWEGAQQKIEEGITAVEAGIAQMEPIMKGLSEAQGTLDGMTIETQFQLASGAAALISAQGQLTAGIAQIEAGLEQFEEALENALKQADMSGVLNMAMISTILKAQNFAMPAGYVKQGYQDYLVRVGDEATSIEEIGDMALMDTGVEEVGVIKLSDVADVFLSDNIDEIYAKINGNDGVLLEFMKQSEFSTTEVTDAILEKFTALESEYTGLRFTPMMNQGDYIYNVINSIFSDLLWGALFAILILLLFLRDIRPTFITLCSIPISLVFALVAMYFTGVSINIISLSGLAIAVGRLVDDSVVVIENIFRLRGKGYSPVKAAISGTMQVAGAITASTLTTICVFLPLVFVQGMTRQIFKDFGLTFAFALLASLAIAMTLVPTLASGLFGKMEPKEHKWLDRMIAVYDKALVWALTYKPVVLIIAVVLLAGSAVPVLTRGFQYMPEGVSSQISASLTMPKESTPEQRRERADEAEIRITGIEGVETVGMMSGESSGGMIGFLTGGSGGGGGFMRQVTAYVLVEEDVDIALIEEEIASVLQDIDMEVSVSGAGSMDITMLGGSGITVNIFGDATRDLIEASASISEALSGIDGIDEINDGMEDATPEIHFTVNRFKAAEHGLTTAQVFQQVSAALTKESTATSILWGGDNYNVVLVNEFSEAGDLTPDYIKKLEFPVTKRDGSTEMVKLSAIAEVSESQTLPSISRQDQRRYMPMNITLGEDYNVTLMAQEVERALAGISLPYGVSYEVTGESATIMDAFEQLGFMLLLGLLLVYLIMVAQFQSLKSPFIIMFTVPLAFTGGFLALIITGKILSVVSLIGFAMLVGVIVANAIVLVDYINRLRLDGMERVQAIREGAATRMRPILMTALATIGALLMMALAIGNGSRMMQPLAIVCIGGLAYGTLMTLFVIPIIYDTFSKKELRKIAAEDLVVDREA